MGGEVLSRSKHGDGLDFEQKLLAGEATNLYGGTRGQLLRVDKLVAYLADDRHLRHIDDEVGELDYITKATANSAERDVEILEDLLRLSAHVALAHDIARWVKRHLPGDIDRAGASRLNDMGVSSRVRERRRVDIAMCHFVLHG